MPTTLERDYVKASLEDGTRGFHESLLRSYHILAKVKWLLDQGAPPEVVRELIALMEDSVPAKRVLDAGESRRKR